MLLLDEWRASDRVMNHEAVHTHQITENRNTIPDRQGQDEVCGLTKLTAAYANVRGQTSSSGAQSRRSWTTRFGPRTDSYQRMSDVPKTLCRHQNRRGHALWSMQAIWCNTKASTTTQAVCHAFNGMSCPNGNEGYKELEDWQQHISIQPMGQQTTNTVDVYDIDGGRAMLR